MRAFTIGMTLPLSLAAAWAGAQYARPAGKTLRELAVARNFHIGANFPNLYEKWREEGKRGTHFFDPEAAIAKDHFTIMTAGWENFPGNTWKGEGQYNFEGSDKYIAWCKENGIAFHAHGLGYVHRAGWPFAKMPVETEAEKAKVRQVYEQYIRDTASHFKGRVYMWDICNEHLLPPYQMKSWLKWSAKDGPKEYWKAYNMNPRDRVNGYDFYVKSFQIAHKADPQAKLILLDFNNEIVCPKSDNMLELVQTLKALKLPIHGVGFQLHINTQCKRVQYKKQTLEPGGHDLADDAYFDSMRKNIQRFTDLGMEVWITEMSVDVDPAKDLQEELKRQAEIYRWVFEVCLENPGMKGIKLWGVCDDKDWKAGKEYHPYLFDKTGKPKPAFFAVQETLANYKPKTGGR